MSGLSGSLPPISLGPSRPTKMNRLTASVPEVQNAGEIVTVLQTQPQSAPGYQTVRQLHYRSAPQGNESLKF